jgi:hypothetical protein
MEFTRSTTLMTDVGDSPDMTCAAVHMEPPVESASHIDQVV